MRTLRKADDATCAAAVTTFTGDINEVTAGIGFPLLQAVFRFLPQTIAALGSRGDCDPEVSMPSWLARTALQHTALQHTESYKGDRLKALLTAFPHINVNRQDDRGLTALHSAVKFQGIAEVELLLSYGADPSIKDKRGRTAEDIMERDAWLLDIKPVFAAHRKWVSGERAPWIQAVVAML